MNFDLKCNLGMGSAFFADFILTLSRFCPKFHIPGSFRFFFYATSISQSPKNHLFNKRKTFTKHFLESRSFFLKLNLITCSTNTIIPSKCCHNNSTPFIIIIISIFQCFIMQEPKYKTIIKRSTHHFI